MLRATSADKYIFPQVVAPWMDTAKPTPEQISTVIHDWVTYGIRADMLLREQATRIRELETQLSEAQNDGDRLDWISHQHLDGLSVSLIVDAPHDGEYCITVDYKTPFYGKTFRDCIDAAIAGESP